MFQRISGVLGLAVFLVIGGYCTFIGPPSCDSWPGSDRMVCSGPDERTQPTIPDIPASFSSAPLPARTIADIPPEATPTLY